MKGRVFGQRTRVACATAFAVGLVGLSGNANGQLDELIPTRIALLKFAGSPPVGRQYKFVSKAPGGGPLFQLPSSSPATTGGSLTVTIGNGTLDCTLPAGLFNGTVGWKELGSPAGSKGYKYLNKSAPTADPCKVVIVKEKAISVIALGTGTLAAPVDYPPGSPDRSKLLVHVTNCDSMSGVLSLGPTTPAEVGERHCTSGRKCSLSGTPCVMDRDCPPAETCETQCLFGAPVPVPITGTPVISYCMVNHIAEDVSGTAECDGGDVDMDVAVRAVIYQNGDLFNSSTPPDIPGVQPCPLCDYLCQSGSKDRFPCDHDSECPGGSCGTTTECLGGPNDGDPCTPGTSDSQALGDSENAYPTSHDCGNDPFWDVTSNIGGLALFFKLTTGTDEWNAVDRPEGSRVFCGYCRDVSGQESLCFEGNTNPGCPVAIPPADGNAVACDSDADCNDGDPYESCVQHDPGAFSEASSTRISVTGSTDGGCLADGQPHPADLVSILCYPPTFEVWVDAGTDLPGPGLTLLQGDMRLE